MAPKKLGLSLGPSTSLVPLVDCPCQRLSQAPPHTAPTPAKASEASLGWRSHSTLPLIPACVPLSVLSGSQSSPESSPTGPHPLTAELGALADPLKAHHVRILAAYLRSVVSVEVSESVFWVPEACSGSPGPA